TPEMRAAMAAAEVGDEQSREDPTVNELQRRAAELLGQEAALFLPTATMANQIALKVLTRPGCLLLAEERTHVMIFEAGGPAVHSGLVMHGLPGVAGRIAPEQLRDVVAASEDVEPASVVVLENTHRSAGGRVCPLAEGLADAGLPVDVDAVETNFVGVDVDSMGIDVADARARIADEGVLVGFLRPGVLRVATYLGITDEDVERAIEAIPRALVGA